MTALEKFDESIPILSGPKTLVTTKRLTIREVSTGDASRLLDLDTDPDVLRYIPVSPKSLAEYAAQIRRFQAEYACSETFGTWAADIRDSNHFVGWFCLRSTVDFPFKQNLEFDKGDIELGFRLRTAYWGQGLATEGATELVNYVLCNSGAARIVASTLTDNLASCRVLEKIGMRRVGIFSIPVTTCPVVKYELLLTDVN